MENEASQARHSKNTVIEIMLETQPLPINFELFSEFIISVNLPDNFKLPFTLHLYDGIGDPNTYITMFKFMMLLNAVFNPFSLLSFFHILREI